MTDSRKCPQCGAGLPADAPDAPCPACLMKLGLQSWTRQVSDSDDQLAATQLNPVPFQAPSIEELAKHFPQLELIELLGQGGMGAVYKARQKSLDRTVALKVIKPSASAHQGFADRFAREAKALARLNHQNIVTVHDFGEAGQHYFFVMEYVDGVNLRQAMKAGELSPGEALAVVPQICDALQYAHDEGVVHRDIKPENILLDKKGRVKIADFGLAKLLGSDSFERALTSTHQVMGTMHYMAPEQLERPLDVDHRADIYSLGVVFYELMTGELPLGRFKLPSEKELDARLDEIVLRTLEREPSLRYQHAGQVKTDVQHLSAGPVSAGIPPRRAAAGTLVTLPFSIDKDGSGPIATGLLRFNGIALLLEMEVKDPVVHLFKTGMKQVEIPLRDLSDIELRPGWFRHSLLIQAVSLQAINEVPGHDRGRIRLLIAKRDQLKAEQVVEEVRRELGEPTEENASARLSIARRSSTLPHLGLIVMGGIMLLLGAIYFPAGMINQQEAFKWVGLGIFLGGGGCLARAWAPSERLPRPARPQGQMIAMGSVMALVGLGLIGLMLLTEHFYQGEALTWIGFALALGGGGCFITAWQSEDEPLAGPPPVAAAPGHAAVATHRPPGLSETELIEVRRRLVGPAYGLIMVGVLSFGVIAAAIVVTMVQLYYRGF